MKTPKEWIETISKAEGERVLPILLDEEDIASVQTDAFWTGVRAALSKCVKSGFPRETALELHRETSIGDHYDKTT